MRCDARGRLWVGSMTDFAAVTTGSPDVVEAPQRPRAALAGTAVPNSLGRPEGCASDAEGYIWSTRYGAGQVIRFAPDRCEDAGIELPASQPTSCTCGGATCSTLYITTARQRLSVDELARRHLAGHLFAVDLATYGLPDHAFAGQRFAPGAHSTSPPAPAFSTRESTKR